MDVILGILPWIKANWVEVCAALFAIDQTLGVISKLTPWKWDDRLSRILADIVGRFFRKSGPTA